MNAPVPPAGPKSPRKPQKPPKRDPWEGLEPSELVRLYRERGLDATLGAWGPRLKLSQEIGGHAVIVYAGREGERAWKALCSMHPEARVIAPRWATADGGRAMLVRQGEVPEKILLSCELSEVLSVIATGEVALPGSVEGNALLRWKPDAHLGIVDPPDAPAWLVTITRDESEKAEARELVKRAATLVATEIVNQEVAIDASRALAQDHPRPSRFFDRGDSVELAAAIISDLRSQAQDAGDLGAVYDRGTFWVYSPALGIYEERDLPAMLRLCAAYAGTPTGPKGKPLSLSDGAIKGAVKVASWHLARPGYFDGAPKGMVFANAFVTARDGQVVTLEHSPAHRAIHALPVPYQTGSIPSRWLAMLREIFRRVIDREENEPEEEVARLDREDTDACIDLLQEWTGTTLLGGATARAICMILVGNGNDGKSSILSVLRALFPPSSVCSIAVQDWSRGFLLACLSGKRINVVSELPERELIDGDRFKAVVAGDPLTAERKNQDPFDLICEAGHIFACNALPATRDQSRGFWRRFVVITCDRSFTEAEAVRDLWRTIIAEELAAIAAWAIEGAARAQRLQSFTAPESAARAKAEWQHDTDQVRQCAEECFAVLPPNTPSAEESTIADLYGVYRAWCGTTGHAPMVRNRFASRLKGLGHEHRTTRARLYRLRIVAAWQGKGAGGNGNTGLPSGGEGRYRAPLN